MIPQQTSKDLMDILEKTEQKVQDIESNFNLTTAELEKRIAVIKNVQEYIDREFKALQEVFTGGINSDVENTILITKADNLLGTYDIYGNTVHPAFINTPVDIFNFGTITGKIFKNNANVSFNGTIKEAYKNMLMHDSISGKSITFEEFDDPLLTIEITINPSDLLGATAFNIIEIMPFIPGSFDITGMKVWTMQDYYTSAKEPSLNIVNTVKNVGVNRFMIDQTRDLWKMTMNIKLNYQNSNGKYPFGLKHLYFLKGSYNPDSQLIFKVTKSDYIDWISDDIIIHDQNGTYESTCTEEDIKLYMDYTDGVFSFEIATSKGLTQNEIPRNIKEFWVQMPLKRSLISLSFDKIDKRG